MPVLDINSCVEKVRFTSIKIRKKLLLSIFFFFIASSNVFAAPIAIDYLSSFLYSADMGSMSIEDTQIGSGFNEFGVSGFETTYANNLNVYNFGTVTWAITNRTGANLSNTRFFGFLDAEITESGNSFFNEYGELVSVTGSGAGDTSADYWEIDEPGFAFGDIYDNIVYDGMLDNFNNVPSGLEEDVSLALGFDIGNFLADQTLLATFTISDQDIGGLRHVDPGSTTSFYFNGTAELLPIEVPEPNSLFLLALGLLLHRARRISC
ncbi:MAG: PEP-CTERM sorting domain-containing protein [Porticoccus sp.]|nr:PEP-CTERM sorting domain-containing protein [Porticoccus sp.]